MEALFNRQGIALRTIALKNQKIAHVAFTDDLIAKNLYIEISENDVLINGKHPSSLTNITVCSADQEKSYAFCVALLSEPFSPMIIFRIVKDTIDFINTCSADTILDDLVNNVITGTYAPGEKLDPAGNFDKEVLEIGIEEFNNVLRIIKDESPTYNLG